MKNKVLPFILIILTIITCILVYVYSCSNEGDNCSLDEDCCSSLNCINEICTITKEINVNIIENPIENPIEKSQITKCSDWIVKNNCPEGTTIKDTINGGSAQECCRPLNCDDWLKDNNNCPNHQQVLLEDEIRNCGIICNEQQCCTDKPLCSSYESCPSHQQVSPSDQGKQCDGLCDTQYCCTDKPLCSTYESCPSHQQVSLDDQEKQCDGVCDTQQCCSDKPLCSSYESCPSHQQVSPDNQEKQCDGLCDTQYCCTDKPLCSTFYDCPDTQFVSPDDQDKQCDGFCDIQQCCIDKPMCIDWVSEGNTCNEGYILKENYETKDCITRWGDERFDIIYECGKWLCCDKEPEPPKCEYSLYHECRNADNIYNQDTTKKMTVDYHKLNDICPEEGCVPYCCGGDTSCGCDYYDQEGVRGVYVNENGVQDIYVEGESTDAYYLGIQGGYCFRNGPTGQHRIGRSELC